MQQKTAGLYSFGGCLGGFGARALMPLVRLGLRTKSKNKKRYVLAFKQCTTDQHRPNKHFSKNALNMQQIL